MVSFGEGLLIFFGGCFFCNSVPHFIKGIMGEHFQTPFAKPRGIGESPPLINLLWSWFNIFVSFGFLALGSFDFSFGALSIFLFGMLPISLLLSAWFTKAKSGEYGYFEPLDD